MGYSKDVNKLDFKYELIRDDLGEVEEILIDKKALTDYINRFCESYQLENDIPDLSKVTEIQFTAFIKDLYLKIFKPIRGVYFEYDRVKIREDILPYLMKTYTKLCDKYNKIVLPYCFLAMLGLEYADIANKLPVTKKLEAERERSLTQALIASGDKRPTIGLIATLNHLHGWSGSDTESAPALVDRRERNKLLEVGSDDSEVFDL